MDKEKIENQIIIAKLISKSFHRRLSTNEQKILDSWLKKNKHNQELYSRLVSEKKIPDYVDQIEDINPDKAKQIIYKKIKKRKNARIVNISLKYAATLILILGCTYFFILTNSTNTSSSEIKIKKETITLQMSNGEVKIIDISEHSDIIDKKGKTVGVQSGSKLMYNKSVSTGNIAYNTLNIPYGKRFQIELSDGTLVYLNSGSSLRYPVSFIKGAERRVFVSGEAYFEVFEDKTSPFIVNAKGINIRVLGTKFNVSSYEEDNLINTVLVMGSIRLFDPKQEYKLENSTKLEPGHMASWNKLDSQIMLNKVDTELYIAWTKGKLVFNNTPFKTIRKKLERHYNVSIINNNKILDEKTYNATFDIETIEQVLNSFRENFLIEFSIVDNKIIIN